MPLDMCAPMCHCTARTLRKEPCFACQAEANDQAGKSPDISARVSPVFKRANQKTSAVATRFHAVEIGLSGQKGR